MDATNYAVAAEVMNAFDPVTIKHNGIKITVTESWADKAPLVMETGVHAKFAQNDFLLDSMKITGSRTFQECNRYDTYWGIGVSLSDAKVREDHSEGSEHYG